MSTEMENNEEHVEDNGETKAAVELLTPQERQQNGGSSSSAALNERPSLWARMATWLKVLLVTLSLLCVAVLVLLGVVLVRTALASSPTHSEVLTQLLALDVDLVQDNKTMERAERLAGALRFPTISRHRPEPVDHKAFTDLHAYLENKFPELHNSSFVKREFINEKSLLYTVTGTVEGKLPYMLTSHLDVVPANSDTWDVPPYSGEIVNDTYIYGRGALDDKSGVMGILEALEYMIGTKQEQPKRSFYIAFGHDEEIGGRNGAMKIAEALTRRGVKKLDFIVDEGHPIIRGLVPGTDKNVAMIGVTEKGFLTLELTVKATPGHSSFPPWESAIVMLADAVSRLEKNKLPIAFGKGPERHMYEQLAPHVNFYYRMLFSNLWLFGDLMALEMQKDHRLNAQVRTTTAVTMFHAGNKANVVPGVANASVNHRVHPADSIAWVVEEDQATIDNEEVKVRVVHSLNPLPVAPFGAEDVQYQTVVASVLQAIPDTICVPGIMIANTDMASYLNFTHNIYRILPAVAEMDDLSRYHGNNERISVQDFSQAVSFYYRIMKNADALVEQTQDLS